MLASFLVASIACLGMVLAAPTQLVRREDDVPIKQEDFDRLNLGLNFELLELDLFNLGLDRFSKEDWESAGYPASFVDLVRFMRDQEVAHASAIQQILQGKGAKPCEYQFPDFAGPKEYIEFSSIVTSVGEAGYLGFTNQLYNRSSILTSTQIFTTEARQNAVFRQARGLNPLNANFDTPLTESQSYTLNAPYIKSCPPENPPIPFKVLPTLKAKIVDEDTVQLEWKEDKEKRTDESDGNKLYAAWINQLDLQFVEVTEDGKIPVPKGVFGNSFVVLTKRQRVNRQGPLVADEDVVAGPAAVVLPSTREN
ncbi:hypothetical protein PhCBS80983_g01201 [Powellomyces hirtus]|uniref:Ferritin-like diiron domain-containing protein n=1 Tax=Powellomyces hirtus TaxID=109895 RepID=A0A507EB22_9FUNG|nr:hypothetical protein PhCBS80983_g01201 [Powellomyces hirtus]